MKIRAVLFTLLLIFCFLSISTNQYKFQISRNEEKNILKKFFGSNIDTDNLLNYSTQNIPSYITKKNSNTITDSKATLRRILFYDHSLSISNKIVCASCHQQNFAFGDTFVASHGVYGALSSRHSMRLINNRFQVETKFFWDERAISLENQIPQTKENFNEMGYSGTGGRQDINALILKLNGIDYYKLLFSFVYRESLVAIPRLQESIAHFIRSIQSFYSKYDSGRAIVSNENVNFPNFSTQ